MEIIFVIHVLATVMMIGIIWFVQIVHYPLFDRIGSRDFAEYESNYTNMTGRLVGPVMMIELGTAVWLLLYRRTFIQPYELWAGLIAIACIWFSTLMLQAPQHRVLMSGYNDRAHRRLIRSNWIRTVLWSARGMMLLLIIQRAIEL